jgi:hypothetical protein
MESSVPPGRIFGWSYLRDHRQVWCFLDLTLRPDVEEFWAGAERLVESVFLRLFRGGWASSLPMVSGTWTAVRYRTWCTALFYEHTVKFFGAGTFRIDLAIPSGAQLCLVCPSISSALRGSGLFDPPPNDER